MIRFFRRKKKAPAHILWGKRLRAPGAYIKRDPENKGRIYLCFPDGLRLIFERDVYTGFYTEKPCDR